MNRIFILTIFLLTFGISYSQTKKQTACDSLISEGFTQAFCDYNANYSFKNIPFESGYGFVSSKIKLTKSEHFANTYLSKDINVREWAGLTFDFTAFKFSAKDKLESVVLLLNRQDNDTASVREDFLVKVAYLTILFGKREPTFLEKNQMNFFHWMGNKVNIYLSRPDNNTIKLLFERTNIKDLDNL